MGWGLNISPGKKMLQARLIMWACGVAALLGAIYGIYHYGRHVEGLEWQVKIAEANQKNEDAAKAVALEFTNRLIKAGGKYNEAIRRTAIVINDLDQLRVVVPSCPSPAAATETSASADPAGGVANLRVKQNMDDTQRALDEARRAINAIVNQCAALNLDAIRANESR